MPEHKTDKIRAWQKPAYRLHKNGARRIPDARHYLKT
jgi:hypothetical protein